MVILTIDKNNLYINIGIFLDKYSISNYLWNYKYMFCLNNQYQHFRQQTLDWKCLSNKKMLS